MQAGGRGRTPRLAEGLRVRQKPSPALRPGVAADKHLPSDPGCPPRERMQARGRGRTSPPAWRKVFACDKNRRRPSARGSRRTNTCRLIRAAPREHMQAGGRGRTSPRLSDLPRASPSSFLSRSAPSIAKRGFDPRTFGLWAHRANHCATPLDEGISVNEESRNILLSQSACRRNLARRKTAAAG